MNPLINPTHAFDGTDRDTAPAVVLVSHGSLLCGAGTALRRHADGLGTAWGDRVAGVWPGFLNYSEPPVEAAIADAAAAGARRIVVAPYFLVSGKFVKVDVTARVEAARAAWPGVEFALAQPLGDDLALADAVTALVPHAEAPARWDDTLDAAPASCADRPDCPLHGTPRCPATGGGALPAIPRPAPSPRLRDEIPPALLVVVHGSPRPESNDAVRAVLSRIEPQPALAFMECNEPSIPDAVDALAAAGARRVTVVPYFLHTGNHVADDIPTILRGCLAGHPDLEIGMTPYLGSSPALTDILRRRAEAAAPGWFAASMQG